MIVYSATNRANGKRYIGLTEYSLSHRKSGHLSSVKEGSRLPFHNALRRYGVENFDWKILYQGSCRSELIEVERRLISELQPEYNVAMGGDGLRAGYRHSPEAVANMTKATRLSWNDSKRREETSRRMFEFNSDPERRKRVSVKLKSQFLSPEKRAEMAERGRRGAASRWRKDK